MFIWIKFFIKDILLLLKKISYSIVFVSVLLILAFAPYFINIGSINDVLFIFTDTNHFKQVILFVTAFIFEASILLIFSFVKFDLKSFIAVFFIGISIIGIVISRNNSTIVNATEYYNIPVIASILLCCIYKTISMNDLKKIKQTI